MTTGNVFDGEGHGEHGKAGYEVSTAQNALVFVFKPVGANWHAASMTRRH